MSSARFRLAVLLLCVPLLATLVAAGAYLRSALQHRDAVRAGGQEVAGVMLRDIFDVVVSRTNAGARIAFNTGLDPWVRAEAAGAAVPPLRVPAEGMVRAAAALEGCDCDAAFPARGAAVWDPAGDSVAVVGQGASPEAWRARLASLNLDFGLAPGRFHTAAGRGPGGSWFLYALPLERRDGVRVVLAAELDLDALGQEVMVPAWAQVVEAYLGPEAAASAAAGFRVEHPSGRLVLRRGDPEAGPAWTLQLWDEDLLTTPVQHTRPFRATLALHPDVLGRVIPGGLPGSPWPLVSGMVTLALLLTGLGGFMLWRIRELLRLRERFVASVSHELRTPLAKMLVYAETLALERPTPAARRRAAGVVVRETRRLVHLVENTLDFAGGRRPAVRLVPERVDLSAVVAEALEGERSGTRDGAAELRLYAPEPVRACADPAAVERILRNLLDNARRYGPAGQTITVAVTEEGRWGRLSVEDEGPGIPRERRNEVLRPFRRLERPGAPAGTGLGLAIVAHLAEVMEGGVEVGDAASGRGARVTVRLPKAGLDTGGEGPWPGS